MLQGKGIGKLDYYIRWALARNTNGLKGANLLKLKTVKYGNSLYLKRAGKTGKCLNSCLP
ncbi:MAG: hypothetical protein DWB56_10255 [Candidatus Jettenia sp.]|uniref:Uncharacterized protein n=1 Tax=Candidatus Jettenia caeni TaxID=247490 RepID=I3IL06_9BACT|nr:MAG: hypothetical protein EDM77_07905 [Candidatus Jettenia sp. AMX1]MBC6929326.1 hypothetical protein [Candidatus Jettenia sp.]MCE7880761.1 hypothetical protein [Candidatus Jettenia sp. AMX1]MCQ3927557.1 hypothetical protein [Candidatus Jettenia sp.]GAB62401.1 hypothetical protein KSU1_C0805 [Candidatus Jettenia caeni]